MFDNPFTRKDPVAESVKAAINIGDLQRKAEKITNEQYGVYSRKAVIREKLADYDASLKDNLKGLQEGTLSEEVQIDELSKTKLGKYIEKNVEKRGDDPMTGRPKTSVKDLGKRRDGLKTAVNKLSGHAMVNAKEETLKEAIMRRLRESFNSAPAMGKAVDEGILDFLNPFGDNAYNKNAPSKPGPGGGRGGLGSDPKNKMVNDMARRGNAQAPAASRGEKPTPAKPVQTPSKGLGSKPTPVAAPGSFKAAWEAARKEAGTTGDKSKGQFTWNGKQYQTNDKGEKYVAANQQHVTSVGAKPAETPAASTASNNPDAKGIPAVPAPGLTAAAPTPSALSPTKTGGGSLTPANPGVSALKNEPTPGASGGFSSTSDGAKGSVSFKPANIKESVQIGDQSYRIV